MSFIRPRELLSFKPTARDAFSSNWKTYLSCIDHCRNVRGLEKSMIVFRLCELRYANERSTKFESLYRE